MPKFPLLLFACLLLSCVLTVAQSPGDGQFGCPGPTQFFGNTSLAFAPLSQAAISRWGQRPSVSFSGFEETRYGFQEIAIYTWRTEVQQSDENGDSVYRLRLAVRLTGARGVRWFELVQPLGNLDTAQTATNDDLLHMQANASMLSPRDTGSDESSSLGEMANLVSIRLATPTPSVPLFVVDFGYRTPGVEAETVVSNRLLLDLRSGKPRISGAVQCPSAVAAGTCDSPDQPKAGYDNLRCLWDTSTGDFRCTMTSPFGGEYASRTATRDFYLLSGRPAWPAWYTAQTPSDLLSLALQLSANPASNGVNIMVPELGPVNLIASYKDLLPGTETLIFSSPGAGPTVNAHFWLVTISSRGSVVTQSIEKWVISGEKTDEGAAPAGYTPEFRNDEYRTTTLEDRAGFHAVQVVMTSDAPSGAEQGSSQPVHVVYWVGVQAANGKLISSAVRVASDGSTHGSCAADAHDGTAISIEQQGGMAAATVHVRPAAFSAREMAPPQPDDAEIPAGCVWIGALYWKPGAGFRVRKTDQDCDEGAPQVSITKDGQISVQDSADQEQ
jgi:hypothetical protein